MPLLKTIPTHTGDLLNELERVVPDARVDPVQPERMAEEQYRLSMAFMAGRRSLYDDLRKQWDMEAGRGSR